MGTESSPLRVAIAEDSLLLRDGLVRLLTSAGLEVTAQCGTADELLLHVRSYPPDVVVVDIRLPPTHTDEGMRAALRIREQHPGVGVLVLSQYLEAGLATQLLGDSAEGVGYLLKDRISDVDDFVGAVRVLTDALGTRSSACPWIRRTSSSGWCAKGTITDAAWTPTSPRPRPMSPPARPPSSARRQR